MISKVKAALKLFVLIFSCYKYFNRIDKLKNIGYFEELEKEKIKYLIIMGNPSLDKEYIIYNNILMIKTEDTYKEFPKKVIKAFTIVNQIYN